MDSKLEAVISGIAGKFPECFSVDELWERLLSKSVLIKQDDFMTKLNIHNESDQFSRGLMPEWNKFDNQFFGVPYLLVRNCEPVLGMFLEKTFEALLDSGINPFSLKGRNVAVLAALSTSDVEVLRYSSGDLRYGIGMVGQSRAMLANRISYFFNFTGPSYTTDSSWLGAMYCLKKAADLVSSGVVEAAVVATASKLLSPVVDKQYRALGLIAGDGVCQPFDNEGHGFVRSEAAVVFFIQGRKDAKRIYATLKKAETKFIGAKNCSFIQLDPEVEKFLRNFYSDRNENPEDVSYIEAHGTCFKDTDAQELNALAGVFCSQKETPQLIGSITGNVGNTESCCGLVAIVKVIMAMEHGVIPPTVNYHTPNLAVPALLSGKLKPVTEKTELLGDLVAVNTLSVSNAVSHVLLKRHDKVKKTLTKTNELPEDGLPRLVLLQARNEQGAKMICDKISSMPVDVEFISMVNDAFNHQIPAYLWRGYTVVPSDITSPALKIQQFKAEKRPLWFVFSGMGSQWIGMGKELLQIPVFKLSVEKCDEVLRPKGVDIFHILSSNDPSVYDNILNCFVGINAIQIGLMDVLKELKITPDGIIGHSVGELGCAYADGCFTAEETILAAYARGKASLDSLDDDYIKGSMAAVGLSYDNIKHKLPPSIDVACHNSQGSCTLSGPTNDIVNFVEKLSSEGVFARAVSAGGIAYHSRYIRTIAPKLLNALKEIIASPKPRSSKWISTSVPESQWDTDGARLCSAEYHTNNLLNPVYFQEGCKHLPDDAILLEIAPHGLLQAILRRAVKPSSQCLSLTSRTVQSNLKHLLNCLGELHLNNVSVDINALYPKVEYPVSRGTPSLATLATWEHQSGHYSEVLSIIRTVFSVDTFERTKHVSATDPEYQLWKEHRFAGQVVLPFPQILMYPLDMILTSIHQNIEQHCTVIEDVIIGNNVSIDEVEKEIYTTYYPSTLKFEVYCNSTNILSGKVVESQSKSQALTVEPVDNFSITEVTCGDEIYHTLSELGYDVGPQFKLIKNIDFGKKECIARVKWNGNMITFLDSLIKIVIIFESRERNMLLIPKAITKMTVDGPCLRALSYEAELEVLYQSWCSRIVCKGAELVGLSFKATKLMDFFPLAWAELKFQPYFDNSVKVNEFLSSSVETAAEDGLKSWADDSCIINILILNTEENCFQYSHLRRHLMSRSNIEVKVLSLDFESAKKELDKTERKTMIVVGDYDSISGLLDHSEETDQLYCVTHISGSDIPKFSQRLRLVSAHKTDSGRLVLLKRVTLQEKFHLCSIESSGWLSALRNFVEKEKKKNEPILVVTRNLTPRELLPVLSKEPFAYRIRTVFIEDRDAPQFSLSSSFYSSQLSLGLPVNILSGGVWGSLRKVSLDISPCNLNLDSLVNSSNNNLVINCVGLNTTFYTPQQEPLNEELEVKCLDYSGNEKDKRVMGVAYFKPKSSSLSPDSTLQWTVPADWTMEDAATVPVLYTLAYYCITQKAELKEGEYVLIHAGMTPIGQAMISVALQAGARIITSVVDEEEALHLMKHFPNLNHSQVFVLEKEDISVAVMKRTGTKGVRAIINCLRGKDFHSTIKTADSHCRCINLAEMNIEDKEIIGLYHFFENRSAIGVSLNSIKMCSDECKKFLRQALMQGISQGIVRPLKKRTVCLREFPNFLRKNQRNNKVEKIVVVSKYRDDTLTQNGNFQFELNRVHIITGKNVDLKFQLAEWLIDHGAKKIIMVNDDETNEIHYLQKINRIVHRKNCVITTSPSSCLDSVESTLQFLKEVSRFGSVSSIFCVRMDEKDSHMKNLDSASRQLLPGLQKFVSLLGKGSVVCDSRARNGLPACSIQTKRPLESPAKILPYLFSLLTDSQKAKFYLVSGTVSATKVKDEVDLLSYLPSSVEELIALGESIEACPKFVEQTTLSLRYSLVKHNFLPVFVVPGLGRHSVESLLRRLMYPAFCCSLPEDVPSIDELAATLAKDISEIQPSGPYNIVGDSWGGALALTIGRLLDARGEQVTLTLIQGVPTTAQNRLRALSERFGSDLRTCIVNAALNTQEEIISQSNWKEMLAELLPKLEPDVREPVSRAVNALNNQFNSLLRFKPSSQLFKGEVTLIRNKSGLLQDIENISKFCQNAPKVVTIDETNHHHLLSSRTLSTAILENMAFI